MNWIDLTNGPQGVRSIPALAIGSLKLETPQAYYYAAFGAAWFPLFSPAELLRAGSVCNCALFPKTSLHRRCREFRYFAPRW